MFNWIKLQIEIAKYTWINTTNRNEYQFNCFLGRTPIEGSKEKYGHDVYIDDKICEYRFGYVEGNLVPSAMATTFGDEPAVFMNTAMSKLSDETVATVIEHEIGHIVLGHVAECENIVDEADSDEWEIAADDYATKQGCDLKAAHAEISKAWHKAGYGQMYDALIKYNDNVRQKQQPKKKMSTLVKCSIACACVMVVGCAITYLIKQ